MEKSPEIGMLAKALWAFQADMENVGKDAVNPFFKSKYASLENIITSAKPHLKKHGLSFAQLPDGQGLTTVLMHDSGEFISASAAVMAKDQTPQGQGSAITYMRRYALSGVLGIATEDDDDGNEASAPRQTAKPAAQRTAPSKTEAAVRYEANKDRLKVLLAKHGAEEDLTVKQVKDAVFDITGLLFNGENIEEVNEALAAKLTAKSTK